ncbi:hypothetical protein M5C89_21315 [Bacillus velezensis]|nr:hypothetical protein M5C89_21315 [Bacillus velezensis]
MGSFDLETAGNFLWHSLDDHPKARSFPAGSTYSNGFSNTAVYSTISKKMAAKIKSENKKGHKAIGGSNLSAATSAGNAGLDWYLTIGKFAYDWYAEKQSGGKWKVWIGIHDTYDYQTIKKSGGGIPGAIVKVANNYAADAQKAGALVPYNIDMYMEQTYKP